MKKYTFILGCLIVVMLLALPGSLFAQTTSLSSTFTYQGYLTTDSGPVNNACDFQFGLFNATTVGSQIGSTLTRTNISVTTGVFNVQLDFGAAAFDGTDRYLNIGVRCPTGSGNYISLTPRQSITAAPYALGLYGLKVQQNATSPNLIGGYVGNTITAGVVGAVISGGGSSNLQNSITDNYGTISGGYANSAIGTFATIGGGYANSAGTAGATVAGGEHNTASGVDAIVAGGTNNSASGVDATVAGGYANSASSADAAVGGGSNNTANGTGTTIGGGFSNKTTDDYSTVNGGWKNTAGNGTGTTSDQVYATVGGGGNNNASGGSATISGGAGNNASGSAATVGGGAGNNASGGTATVAGGGNNNASGGNATISGGNANTASGDGATVGGGVDNNASVQYSTISGGFSNTATDDYNTVSGGFGNTAGDNSGTTNDHRSATVGGGGSNTASGIGATIPGGLLNTASGSYSFAAGLRAKAAHDGTFVWADSTDADFSSSQPNQFLVRASGGIAFFTDSGATTGAQLASGSGAWSSLSDRNAKANFSPIDPQTVLRGVINLPLSTWNYNAQNPSIRHIGPMAQDFSAAFGVGEDNTHISTIDSEGVALAAIQGLYQVTQDQKAQLQLKDQQITDLHTQLDDMNTRLTNLEKLAGDTQPSTQSDLPAMGLVGGLVLAGVWLSRRKTQEAK